MPDKKIPDEVILEAKNLIRLAVKEDIGIGDFSGQSCFDNLHFSKSQITSKSKEDSIVSGLFILPLIFEIIEAKKFNFILYKKEGDKISYGEKILSIEARTLDILKAERIFLNFIQRLSGISTLGYNFVKNVKPYKNVKILDTRKTTPAYRNLEKWASNMGGVTNHRMGLYDMIMLKDNHIDFCGGVELALQEANEFLIKENKDLPIVVEVNSFQKAEDVSQTNFKVDRVMLDNFSPKDIAELKKIIPPNIPIEISGGITMDNIKSYAMEYPDYISIGAITHSAMPIDFSLTIEI